MIVFVKKCFILTEGGCHLIFTCSKITIYELSFSKLKYHIRQLFSLEHLIYRWNINIIQKKIGFIYILVLPATFEKQRDNFVLRDNFGPYCKLYSISHAKFDFFQVSDSISHAKFQLFTSK